MCPLVSLLRLAINKADKDDSDVGYEEREVPLLTPALTTFEEPKLLPVGENHVRLGCGTRNLNVDRETWIRAPNFSAFHMIRMALKAAIFLHLSQAFEWRLRACTC